MATEKSHNWKFFKSGNLVQVCLESGKDLINLDKLDPKLWSAMMCPLTNMEFDAKTLEYLDTDGDKRIKIPEIIVAVKWACSILKDPNSLLKPQENLPLSEIDDSVAEGKQLLESAKQILKNLGKGEETSISMADLADTKKIFAATAFNGDGVISAESWLEEAVGKYIFDATSCVGTVQDRSGKPGINLELLDNFLAECKNYFEWYQSSKSDDIMFAGDASSSLYGFYSEVKVKIEDYFTRCKLVSFDKRYEQVGQILEAEYVAILKKSLSGNATELKDMPLALASDKAVLPMYEHTNPAWAGALVKFAENVSAQIVGEGKTLSESQWNTIKAKIAPYEAWVNSKKGASVEKLGIARVEEILKCGLDKEVKSLIERDKSLEPQFKVISTVDKLVRYYKYLYLLLNNFVAFSDFYCPEKKAIFQAGTLYMDGRSCELCVKVDDIAGHSSMAASSNIFLAYCKCIKKGTNETINIVAGFTDGESEDLIVGRNGIFVDRAGTYWDAVINKVIDHPISIRQAFWSPYRRLGKMINEQIEKFASSKDKDITASISASVDNASKTAQTAGTAATAQPVSAFDVGKFAGIFAAIGLALAALGSAVASIVSAFLSLLWWQMPLAVLGVLLVISGPSMLLTAMRLRKRSLGGILNANGWAINTKAGISITMGKTMTSIATLPKNSETTYSHPYGESKKLWKTLLVILVIAIAWMLFFCKSTSCPISSYIKTNICGEAAVK